jgi:hypothetical protein
MSEWRIFNRISERGTAGAANSCLYALTTTAPHESQTWPRRLPLARGGAYTFGGGKGSRTGSGLSLARIALSVRMRGENG